VTRPAEDLAFGEFSIASHLRPSPEALTGGVGFASGRDDVIEFELVRGSAFDAGAVSLEILGASCLRFEFAFLPSLHDDDSISVPANVNLPLSKKSPKIFRTFFLLLPNSFFPSSTHRQIGAGVLADLHEGDLRVV